MRVVDDCQEWDKADGPGETDCLLVVLLDLISQDQPVCGDLSDSRADDTRTEAHSAIGRIRDHTELRPGLGGGRSELPRSAAPRPPSWCLVGHGGVAKLTLRRDDARVVTLRRSVFRLSATDRVKPD